MEIILDKKSILAKGRVYIKKFKGKIFVIKYGGSNLDDEHISNSILEGIVYLHQQGIKVVIIHGGANIITRLMQQKGKTPEFIEGFRVTDEETANIVGEALTGINADIVDKLTRLGTEAVSIISKEHGVIRAKRRENSLEGDFAGDVDSINTKPIEDSLKKEIIPVISPVGIGQDDKPYNINADFAGAEIAIALRAEKLILLTNVKGIMRDHINEKSLMPTLTEKEIEEMIKAGSISSGMIPKARACIKALFGGVGKVHIISGRIKHSLLIEVLTDEGIGTEIIL
ncbi:MAG: acetylglutamate kinase [Candidatus Omnitrophota bacterium]|nr:MAG: acetylglutamate kinase [Candidatus Omnitrophota bacterium]